MIRSYRICNFSRGICSRSRLDALHVLKLVEAAADGSSGYLILSGHSLATSPHKLASCVKEAY